MLSPCSHVVVSGCLGFETADWVGPMIAQYPGAGLETNGLAGSARLWVGGLFIAGGHTASNAPDLFRPPKGVLGS